ncbi:MAG TPA: hypothetical protein VMI54_04170 [Polyangiaceae bacterium]|nr:hypothetical protein [Polyangiaceae bacterium]
MADARQTIQWAAIQRAKMYLNRDTGRVDYEEQLILDMFSEDWEGQGALQDPTDELSSLGIGMEEALDIYVSAFRGALNEELPS